MKKEDPDSATLRELVAFACGAEGDVGQLSKDEVADRLRALGVNTTDLAEKVRLRLKRIQNEIVARSATQSAASKQSLPANGNSETMVLRDFAIAARAEDAAAEEDLEVLRRLTQDDKKENASED